MLRLIRGRHSAHRLVVAALLTGCVLLGGTAAVAGGPTVVSTPVLVHGQTAEHAAQTSKLVWNHTTTLGVNPDWNHQLPGQAPSPHLLGEQAANVSSGNWAGFAQDGTTNNGTTIVATYTGVSASWRVPTIQSTPSPSVSSSWIGIDGFWNSDLIQTGTEQDVSSQGVRRYYSWYEILPAPETEIGGVNPGDQMSANIFRVSPVTWTINISDITSSQSFSQNFSYSGPADSAEWIQEMTGISPQQPLANFGTANFTNLNFASSNAAASTPTLVRLVNSTYASYAYPTIPGASDLNVTYGQPSTGTTVTSHPSSVTFGTPITYSASVSPGTPSGSVTFSTGSTPLCTATLSGGSGSCNSSAAPVGSDLVFGTYSGIGVSASTGSTTVSVSKAASQTSVTTTPNPVAQGSSVTYSTTVTSSATGVPGPSGSVTLTTGSTPLCTATLSNGSGSCNSSAAPLGSDTISGTYSGDANFSGSNGTTTLAVEEPSQTAVSTSPGPVTVGTSVIYSATVSTGATGVPTPTGSVTFMTGLTPLCTATLSGGSGSCTSSAAPVGTDTISGAYSGDSVFAGSTGTKPLVVNKASSQTASKTSPGPVTVGTSVIYSATVSTGATGVPTPTGSVTFMTGLTPLCTATLSGGSGSCTSSAAPVGTDTISGTYSGDGVFSGSNGSTSLVVNTAPTQTSIGASPSSVAVGSSVTYSAIVTTSVTGLPTPTGSVAFTTGSTPLCTATLSNGSGSCNSTVAPFGTDTISGAYSGDPNFSGSNGTASLVVEEPSQTAIGASPNPATVGNLVTYSATVTSSGTGTPTGSVTFTTGSKTLCIATLSNGIGTCSSSVAPVGSDTISGTYSGDSAFAGSTGTTSPPLTVNKASPQTSIGATPNSVTQGGSVTYSATVTKNGTGLPTPTGSVTFTSGSTQLCTATLLSDGTASCPSTAAPVGSDTITGTYTGDTVFVGSTGSTTLAVNSPPLPPQPTHGYWLVGSDGGIFTFGSAQFHGSTGSLRLQRPVVGIVPTADRGGYWLDASDGGIFAFGDAGFYGSIPGLGLHPAGTPFPNRLNAPIVGMVPSSDGGGYFMVASDGGVFACDGAAVAVMPDASGNGYWLVTQSGHLYTFGDAPYYGAPGPRSSPVTSAVRAPDGQGYWILFADGNIAGYGDAGNFGNPSGQMGGFNPASAIFTTTDGSGYWVAAADGAVANYGDAPNDGSMLGTSLNGSIIAATGW
jgi:hypothetical protein